MCPLCYYHINRCPAGDNLCNSWNLLDYAAEAPASKTENNKSLMHKNAILKSGVIVFFSGILMS